MSIIFTINFVPNFIKEGVISEINKFFLYWFSNFPGFYSSLF